MNINDINNLMFNPLWTGKLLHYFLCGAYCSKSKKIKFELIYFALPFIYDKKIKTKLANSKNTTSFATLFKEPELKYCLVRKNNQIDAFREITNNALIFIGNQIELKIDTFIQIEDLIDYKKEENPIIREYFKAAYYWGLILAKEDYRNVFVKIGVMNL